MNKSLKMMIFSLTSVTLLAACGGMDTQNPTPEGEQTMQPEQQQEGQQNEQQGGGEDTAEQEANQTNDQSGDQGGDQADDQSSGQNQDQGQSQSDAGSSGGSSEGNSNNDQSSGGDSSEGIENHEFGTSLDEAVQIYRDEVGEQDVSIEEIELDDEDGSYIYEIDGYYENTEYNIDIDAESGDVLEVDTDDEDDDDDVLNLDNIISPQEAMQAALEESGSGYVDDWTLDIDDGIQHYDIDVENGDDQDVDSETGEILDSDQDDDDNGDD